MPGSKVSSCIKWTVLAFNFIIVITGAAILASSLRLLFDSSFNHILAQNGIYFGGQILAGTGALMLIAGILGCIAVLIENPCLLGTFLGFLVIFLVAEITGGVMAYNYLPEFQQQVHYNIDWGVRLYYGNDVRNTTTIDLIQENWKCCGSTSYTSWSNSKYGRSSKQIGTTVLLTTTTYLVPESCCINRNSQECIELHMKGIRNDADRNHIPQIIYQEGCSEKLTMAVNSYTPYLFGIGSLVVLFQILALILTSVLIYLVRSAGAGAHFISKKSYYSGSAASQAMLADQQYSESQKSTPSFAASRSPSLNLEEANQATVYAQPQSGVSSLV